MRHERSNDETTKKEQSVVVVYSLHNSIGSLEMVRHGNGQTRQRLYVPLWKWSDTHKRLHWKWSDKIGTQLEMVRQIYLINPTKPTLVNQDYAALTLPPAPPGPPRPLNTLSDHFRHMV